VLHDGSQAIDVDDERSHALVEALLREREAFPTAVVPAKAGTIGGL
jgi:hypothetical protein